MLCQLVSTIFMTNMWSVTNSIQQYTEHALFKVENTFKNILFVHNDHLNASYKGYKQG